MKPRLILLIALSTLFLVGCDFSLAGDITPPPGYVPPTPMPTLGALYPASAPDIQAGAAIYTANCVPCHGDKGLGDGPQSQQLPVTVPGIGLAEVARSASPAQWYTMVSQGNLDRFMPPFIGTLSDQQRWDVVAYILSLHTTPDQIAQGMTLFNANCQGCSGKFSDLQKMAGLSEMDLYNIIKNGNSEIPAFGKNLTDDQIWAEAAYIRTLTLAAPSLTPTPMAALATTTPSLPAGSGTPQATSATSSAPAATTAVPGVGTITGSIQLASGNPPASMSVTLHGYDHGQDQTTGPQEVLTLTATSAPDGSFVFNQVAMPVNRIFTATVVYNGIQYQSDYAVATAGTSQLSLPIIKLYESSNDFTLLKLSQVHYYTDFATQGTAQFLVIYSFMNSSDKTVILSTDGSTLPFIVVPDGAQNTGYEPAQDSAPFATVNNGVAAPPSDKPYSIIVFFSMPYDRKLKISQPFKLDAPSILLLIPDGMKVEGQQLTSQGTQAIQNVNYQELTASDLKAGEVLTFTVSGSPRTSSTAAGSSNPQGLLAGVAALGLLLIAAGVWLYLRDRRRQTEVESEQDFGSLEDVMDAILALDDLRRAGKISEEAYRLRREDLKNILKGMG